MSSEKGRKMLDELKNFCNNLRVVGSFEKEIIIR